MALTRSLSAASRPASYLLQTFDDYDLHRTIRMADNVTVLLHA